MCPVGKRCGLVLGLFTCDSVCLLFRAICFWKPSRHRSGVGSRVYIVYVWRGDLLVLSCKRIRHVFYGRARSRVCRGGPSRRDGWEPTHLRFVSGRRGGMLGNPPLMGGGPVRSHLWSRGRSRVRGYISLSRCGSGGAPHVRPVGRRRSSVLGLEPLWSDGCAWQGRGRGPSCRGGGGLPHVRPVVWRCGGVLGQ
jgi:hypothetical protein